MLKQLIFKEKKTVEGFMNYFFFKKSHVEINNYTMTLWFIENFGFGVFFSK